MSDPNLSPELSPEPLQRYIQQITAREPKYKHPGLNHDKLFKAEYAHESGHETCEQCNGPIIERRDRSGNHPNIHYGLIASGNQVIKSALIRDELAMKHNILCFEMEAAGMMNSPALLFEVFVTMQTLIRTTFGRDMLPQRPLRMLNYFFLLQGISMTWKGGRQRSRRRILLENGHSGLRNLSLRPKKKLRQW